MLDKKGKKMKKDSILVIIDAQNGLIAGPGAMCDSEKVIENMNILIAKARSLSVQILFIQDSDVGELGSHDWKIDPRLNFNPNDLYLEKSVCDAFHETGLRKLLVEQGIQHLVLTGFRTEYCIDTTVRRATSEGLAVTLVSDGHGTSDNAGLMAQQIVDYHNIILHEFGAYIQGMPYEAIVTPTEFVSFDRTIDVPSTKEWN